MHTIINLRCVDQVLAFDSTPIIASGGVNEVTVHAAFCPKWDGLVKTAVFWRNERDAYHVLLDEHGRCAIPQEVLIDEGRIYLGFFGVDAEGKQRTSQVVSYSVHKGAITYDTAPNNPTADLYTQLLAKYVAVVDIAAAIQTEAEEFEQRLEAEEKAFEQRLEEMFRTGEWNDAYTKAQTLSAETRNLYGADLNAVPDDIFRSIDSRFAKTEAGSYVGTGVGGPDGVVTLTFNFAPKVLMLFDNKGKMLRGWDSSQGQHSPTIGYPQALTTAFASGLFTTNDFRAKRSEDGKTISWYGNHQWYDEETDESWYDAGSGFNSQNVTYNYIAIG